MTPAVEFDALPQRLFLDSCTVQIIGQYGAFIWEGQPIPEADSIWMHDQGLENLHALRRILRVNERALFEWFVSDTSIAEAAAKNDPAHLRWVFDVLDHTRVCLEESGGVTHESAALAERLDEPCFGYLSAADRKLIGDAVRLRCDAFLTLDRRLARNATPLHRELGVHVLSPKHYWAMLEPWAGLYT
jgi:hypothetical protein